MDHLLQEDAGTGGLVNAPSPSPDASPERVSIFQGKEKTDQFIQKLTENAERRVRLEASAAEDPEQAPRMREGASHLHVQSLASRTPISNTPPCAGPATLLAPTSTCTWGGALGGAGARCMGIQAWCTRQLLFGMLP